MHLELSADNRVCMDQIRVSVGFGEFIFEPSIFCSNIQMHNAINSNNTCQNYPDYPVQPGMFV